MTPVPRRSFLIASSLAALALVARSASAAGAWEPHLAKLNAAVKCKAALYGLDGVQWAGHTQLALAPDEAKYVIGGFANPGSLFASGPKLNGQKFMTTRADGSVIVLKHGRDGAVWCKSSKCVVACRFTELDTTPANALVATEKFRDYMKSLGY